MVTSQHVLIVVSRGCLVLRAIREKNKVNRNDEEDGQENGLFAIATARTLHAAAKEEHSGGVGLAKRVYILQ